MVPGEWPSCLFATCCWNLDGSPFIFIVSLSLCFRVVHVSAMSIYADGLQRLTSRVLKGGNDQKTTNAHTDINWAQNIGSALILCLSTISVILQPLLSKFFFLINLVSRNGSSFFSSPPLTWSAFLDKSSCFSVEFHMIIAIVTIVYFSFYCLFFF